MPANRAVRPPKQPPLNGRPPAGDLADRGDSAPLSVDESKVLLDAVERASRVGLVQRTALFAVAILGALLAIASTWLRGDDMVNAILSRNRDTDLLWEQVASLTLPVLLFVLLGVACVAASHVLQSRALDERERALDAISRIRRESAVSVSRARTLARLTEDDLTQVRREFAMQVAFGRASYWLSVSLVAMSAVYSLAEGGLDAYSAAFSAGGVLSYLLGVMFKVPWRVAGSLAALSQRHVIVTGYAREIGIIEANAFRKIGQARKPPETCPDVEITDHAREIRSATRAAVDRIERYCKTDET
jgi:hypothetical protein